MDKKVNKIYFNFLNFLDAVKAVIFDMVDENRIVGKIKSDILKCLSNIKNSVSGEEIDVGLLKKGLMSLMNIVKMYIPLMNPVDLEELPSFPIKNENKVVETINYIDTIISSEYKERFKNTLEAFADELGIEIGEIKG